MARTKKSTKINPNNITCGVKVKMEGKKKWLVVIRKEEKALSLDTSKKNIFTTVDLYDEKKKIFYFNVPVEKLTDFHFEEKTKEPKNDLIKVNTVADSVKKLKKNRKPKIKTKIITEGKEDKDVIRKSKNKKLNIFKVKKEKEKGYRGYPNKREYIIAQIEKRGGVKNVTSKDLARECGVSVRYARMIMKEVRESR